MMNLRERRGELAFANFLSVDSDAFCWCHQVWGSIQAGSQPRSGQNRSEHSAGGSLTVRTGDMNEAASALRISQRREQSSHTLQIPFRSYFQFVPERVKEPNRRRVTHLYAGLSIFEMS